MLGPVALGDVRMFAVLDLESNCFARTTARVAVCDENGEVLEFHGNRLGQKPIFVIRRGGQSHVRHLARRQDWVCDPSGGGCAFAAYKHLSCAWWYQGGTLEGMPTRHPRIQVTEDADLTDALRAAEPHLPAGLSRSRQVRELAIAGARHLAAVPHGEPERRELLARLALRFDEATDTGLDWSALREGKRRGWPAR